MTYKRIIALIVAALLLMQACALAESGASETPGSTPAYTETPAPAETPGSTPAYTETPAPAETPGSTPVYTETPAPAETPGSTPVYTETPAPAETPGSTPDYTETPAPAGTPASTETPDGTQALQTPRPDYPRAVFDAGSAIVDVSQAVQGGMLLVALPIGVETAAGSVVYSNAPGGQSGWSPWAEHSPFYFSQEILAWADDLEWRLDGAGAYAPGALFDLSEGTSRDMLDVAPEKNDWGMAEGTIYNVGYAVFSLPILEDAPAGQHQIKFAYQTDAGLMNTEEIEFTVSFSIAARPAETMDPTDEPTDGPTDEPADGPDDPENSSILIGQMSVQTLRVGQSGVTMAIPVSYADDNARIYSNRDDEGNVLEPGAEGFSQEILDYIDWLEVEITPDAAADVSFPFSLSEQGVTKTLIADGVNYGYAVFSGLTVKKGLSNGTLAVPFAVRYADCFSGETHETTLTALVNITGASSGYGGGSAGGSYTAPTVSPQARVIVESVSTDPADVQAGDTFDLVLSLRNTSAKQYVQNMRVTITSEDDVLIPVSGSSTVYIDRIDAGALYELRFPVRANLDVPDRPLKVDVSVEYEDASVSAQTAIQQLVVNVSQQMRLSISDPVTDASQLYAFDSAAVTLQVINEGRTTLYNVTVTPVSQSENLILPAAAYLGNMEGGTSKKAELSLTPTKEGTYGATLVVSWENSFGERFTEERSLSFSALAEENLDVWGSGSYVEPADPDEPAPSEAGYILELLPWWVYAAVALIYLLIVVYIGFSVRAHRRKVLEDDEDD